MTTAPLYQEPRWLRYIESLCSFVGYIISRGGILAVGALISWLSYVSGAADFREQGFSDGCRAASIAALCDHADELGYQIRKLRLAIPPDKSAPDRIDRLCARMRAELPEGIALHYGCFGPSL